MGRSKADYLHTSGSVGWELTKGGHAIIDELHRVREDFGRAHDFDVRRIAAMIRRHEDESRKGVARASHHGRRVRRRPPKPLLNHTP